MSRVRADRFHSGRHWGADTYHTGQTVILSLFYARLRLRLADERHFAGDGHVNEDGHLILNLEELACFDRGERLLDLAMEPLEQLQPGVLALEPAPGDVLGLEVVEGAVLV